MNRYLKVFFRAVGLELSKHMAYKANFFMKVFAVGLMDVVGPLVIMLIYSTTPGIPGWSFEQFILFQGTLTFIFGLGHMFMVMIPVNCIEQIRDGTFDKTITKPFKPLAYLTLTAIDIDGIGEVLVGLALVVWAYAKLQLGFGVNFLLYLALLLLAIMFEYSAHVFIAAMAFLFVKSWALFDVLFRLKMFGRYPTSIYGPALQLFLTFVFPIAISAFYPVQVLLNGIQGTKIWYVVIAVLGFFIVTKLLWGAAMKNYTSAGG
ncbi:ABC-2 family transporter protein [Candidatus Woesearchaeota archaeon]|nr:ABC-2 family transporter protein [Candidatus Woesearchaeota archaeon]